MSSDLLLWVIGLDHTQTDLKKAQQALAEAAPEEWAAYQRSRTVYEAARTLVVRNSAVKEAEAELKMVAAAEWKAFQKARDELRDAIEAHIKSKNAVKREAPDQYAAIKGLFKDDSLFEGGFEQRYNEAREALKAAVSPDKWERYEHTSNEMFDKGEELGKAEEALRNNALIEIEVYHEAVESAGDARTYRRAPIQWALFYAAEEALILAAPEEWTAYHNALDDDDIDAAQYALSKAAPDEWKAYQSAEDALADALGRRRRRVQYMDF